MHRVQRAIILAAGLGERLRPVTLRTPKPLVRVNGSRMIDTSLRALRANGVSEIFVVVGYLGEQFRALEREYPGIQLVENPYYDRCNNVSSLYAARDCLSGDTMILDGDLIVSHADILSPEFDRSGYCCVRTENCANEWFLDVDSEGVVRDCHIGGGGGYSLQLYGISLWTGEDCAKLRRDLRLEFEVKGNRQIFWDEIPLFCHRENYRIGVREIRAEDILEIDSYRELQAVDGGYV